VRIWLAYVAVATAFVALMAATVTPVPAAHYPGLPPADPGPVGPG
jgi:hypothetical protein